MTIINIMQDTNDKLTAELFSLPKKRGRRPKPDSKSGAERQRAYLQRQKEKMKEINPDNLTRAEFYEFLRRQKFGLSDLANSDHEYALHARWTLNYLESLQISFDCFLNRRGIYDN
jgi:hypothetical protein